VQSGGFAMTMPSVRAAASALAVPRAAVPSAAAPLAVVPSVLAAGVGVRHGWSRPVRSASFRVDSSMTARTAIGIAVSRRGAAAALVDLLAGLRPPSYGELRVLGEDLTTVSGRAAVRGRVGVARHGGRHRPALRVRGLIEHSARLSGITGCGPSLLAAAIIDRLSLTPWAEVPLRAVPEVVGRRASLAAGVVHEPELLLIDSLLDDLRPRDAAALADTIADLGAGTAIVATGRDVGALTRACDEVLTMADGILVRPPAAPAPMFSCAALT
jgi:ABC-2 type transport system ATP-binding protein